MACSAIRRATENDDRESARNAGFGGGQALVEQARTVGALEKPELFCAPNQPVKAPRGRLRFGEQVMRGLEQNSHTSSRWAHLVREGKGHAVPE